MSGKLGPRLGRLEATVDPFVPLCDEPERRVVLIGPDEDPDDPKVETLRLSFNPGDFADADGTLDLSMLTDAQLAELTAIVARSEGEAGLSDTESAARSSCDCQESPCSPESDQPRPTQPRTGPKPQRGRDA